MNTCTLVACPNPLQPSQRMFTHVPAGQTLAQMLGENASHSLAVEVGGRNVPREMWGKVRPKAGQTLHATIYPQGGNAGKYVRMALLIVVSYFAPYLAGYAQGYAWGTAATGIGGAFLTAGIMAVGALAVTPMIGHAREVAA